MSFSALISRLNRHDLPLLPHLTLKTKLSLVTLFVLSSVFLSPRLNAQSAPGTPPSELRYQIDANTTGGNLETWNASSLNATAFSLLNTLTDVKSLNPAAISAIEKGQPVAASDWRPGGVVGSTSGMIASLIYPQASGIEYIASLKDNFLGKPAYAQGTGFNGLQPLLPLWRAFRNMVYLLSSLIFIAVGVMIILKVKISPQATVTLQNSIPRIITVLILVTFSYAIAGLVIDLMYLVTAVIISVLFVALGRNPGGNLINPNIWTGTPIIGWLGNAIQQLYTNFAGATHYDLGKLTNPSFWTFQSMVYNALPSWSIYALSGVVSSVVLGTLGGGLLGIVAGGLGNDVGRLAFGTVGGALGGTIGGILVSLIITVIVVFWLIKLFMGFLKSYVTVIFKIIIAPLEIGIGAFPTSKQGFSSWIYDLIGYIAVFPVTTFFLILLNLIQEQILGSNGRLWIPNHLLIGAAGSNWWSPAAVVSAGLGLVGLGIVSKLPDLVPQAIFALKPSPFIQASDAAYGAIGKNPAIQLGRSVVGETVSYSIDTGSTGLSAALKNRIERVAGPGGRQRVTDALRKQISGGK